MTSVERDKSMSKLTSREICLACRPCGFPTAANFTLAWTASEPLKDQEVLVRNLFMSVDPYMRGRMQHQQLWSDCRLCCDPPARPSWSGLAPDCIPVWQPK